MLKNKEIKNKVTFTKYFNHQKKDVKNIFPN